MGEHIRAHTRNKRVTRRKSERRTGLDDEEVGSLGRAVAHACEDEACDGVLVADHTDELRAVAHACLFDALLRFQCFGNWIALVAIPIVLKTR